MQTRNSSHSAGLNKVATIDPSTSGQTQREANLQLWKLILASGGLGMLGGSALGLGKLLTQNKPYTPDPSYQSVDVMLPEKKKKANIEKLAKEGARGLAEILADATQKYWPKSNDLLGRFFGSQSTSLADVPAFWTLGTLGGLGAGYAGFKGTHDIVDSLRKRELDANLQKTRDEYADFVRKNLANKHASDEEIETELDQLVTECEKRGAGESWWDWMTNLPTHAVNYGASAYIPYALLSALATGKISYDYFKKRSPEKIQEEALQRRAKERYGGTTPIYLEPAPGGEPV